MQARVDSLRVQLASRKAAFQSRAETENSNSKTRRGRVQHPFTSNSDAAAQKSAWAKAEHKLTKGPTRRVSSHLKGPPSWGLMALTSQKLAGQDSGSRTPQMYESNIVIKSQCFVREPSPYSFGSTAQPACSHWRYSNSTIQKRCGRKESRARFHRSCVGPKSATIWLRSSVLTYSLNMTKHSSWLG